MSAAPVPEPRVEVHDVSTNEAVDIARDPTVAAVAIPIDTTLIKPFDIDVGAAADSAWGIAAVKADASTFTGDGVVVAVLDTGIDKSHPAFSGMTIGSRTSAVPAMAAGKATAPIARERSSAAT